MKNGERRWVELCAQASVATDPAQRARILEELAELLVEMTQHLMQPGEKKKAS